MSDAMFALVASACVLVVLLSPLVVPVSNGRDAVRSTRAAVDEVGSSTHTGE